METAVMDQAQTAPLLIPDAVKAAKMMDLAATVAKPKATNPPDRPIHQSLVTAGFVFAKTQTVNGLVAHGYVHADGRAALFTHAQDSSDEAWAIKTTLGDKGGTGDIPPDALKPVTAVQLKDAKRSANKAAAAVERGKKLLDLDRRHAEAHAEVIAAAKVVPPAIAGMPGNVVRAVEMLGNVTARQFDLDLLRGDKRYGHRLSLLKKLFNREKVLVAETGINNLTEAFQSAVGVGEGSKAVKSQEFARRCGEIIAAIRESKAAVARAEKVRAKQNRVNTYLDRVVPGVIMPIAKPLSRRRQAEARAQELEELKATLAVSPDQPAVPRPDVELVINPVEVRLLKNPDNDVVMMQLEKSNSQGAICVYNNGVKVAAGVVAPETLKSLRLVTGEVNLVETVKQLLNPTTPSVPVTSVAARHLTAVLNCKELIAMATTVVSPISQSKKFEAPKATKKLAAKEVGKPVVKAVKATKSEKPAAKGKAESKTGGRTATTLYRLVNDSKDTWSAFKSQKGILVEALVAAGAVGKKAVGITSSDLAAKIGKKLTTNQPVERVVGFYFSQWKKDGVLEAAN